MYKEVRRFAVSFQLIAVSSLVICAQDGNSGSPPSTAPTGASTKSDAPVSKYVPKNVPARVVKIGTTPPVIDGLLNDAVWQDATLFGEFLQTNPGDTTFRRSMRPSS